MELQNLNEEENQELTNSDNISIHNSVLIKKIEACLFQWHVTHNMRVPVQGEVWEDLFEKCLNGENGENCDWTWGGHHSDSDVTQTGTGIGCQNKSGVIQGAKKYLDNMTIKGMMILAKENDIKGPGKKGGWTGMKKNDIIKYLEEKGIENKIIQREKVNFTSHRTSTYKYIEEKVAFISSKKCDKYVLLSRPKLGNPKKKKEWLKNKVYFLMIFDSCKIGLGYDLLNWERKGGKYIGKRIDGSDIYEAWINGPTTSDQLNISVNIDYIGGYHKIIIP